MHPITVCYEWACFLFFYHSDFSLETYGQKLKKRVRTLLIPYIFWNVVVFLLILLSQSPDLVLSPFSFSLLGHSLVLTDIILQLIFVQCVGLRPSCIWL